MAGGNLTTEKKKNVTTEARHCYYAKECKQPPKTRKGEEIDSSLESLEGTRTTDTLTLN